MVIYLFVTGVSRARDAIDGTSARRISVSRNNEQHHVSEFAMWDGLGHGHNVWMLKKAPKKEDNV